LAVGLLFLAGCGGSAAKWQGPGSTSPKVPAAVATISAPADGAANVSTAAEIAYTATNATQSTIQVTDATGAAVEGQARADASTWVPAKQLKYATKYTVTVAATGLDGKEATSTSSFTTMAKPGSLARVSTYIGDNQTVGVGMPIVINFGVDVAKEQRASVQSRLFLTSTPAQEGIWHWFSGKEVHFRPKEYWQKDTQISVRAATGGLSLGGKWYGEKDLTITAKVGPKFIMEVDNKTKQMTVTQDGQLIRTIPVSLGKPSSPSASGNMVVMIKNTWEWFDSSTYGVPADSKNGYRLKVYYPQRITWDGEYVHAAPWSEGDQGKRNVSHGCTNISMAHATWLYSQTRIGDPVIVKNTEQHVKWGNGWTDWDVSWEQYVKGSAIPYTPPAASASPSASTSASPAVTD
jgi:lipoprotein-anchoring transpeptidase ErfK/SrfK